MWESLIPPVEVILIVPACVLAFACFGLGFFQFSTAPIYKRKGDDFGYTLCWLGGCASWLCAVLVMAYSALMVA